MEKRKREDSQKKQYSSKNNKPLKVFVKDFYDIGRQ